MLPAAVLDQRPILNGKVQLIRSLIMKKESQRTGSYKRVVLTNFVLFIAVLLFAHAALAETVISAEPIPNGDVIGANNLQKILSIGYANLELWSDRLLGQCRIVDKVIDVLSDDGAIRSVNFRNTNSDVAAGGFEAVTDPSFVLRIRDSGHGAVSAADVAVLDNALGYVLSQGGTVHFSLDNPSAYDFPLDYAVISFKRNLSGLQAKAFFDYLGTIDPALWSGPFAGFTQVGNSMVFLQPAASKQEFITGLAKAAATYPGARYATLDNKGQPTTMSAGVSFPGNDWLLFPGGDQYLANLGNSLKLRRDLAKLRKEHLKEVADLLYAIDKGRVGHYLNHDFDCPR